MTGDKDFTAQIEADYQNAELTGPDRQMLEYAAKLTRAPWTMQERDIEALRCCGFSGRGILDIAQVVAYYAYVNRIADGLGVSLEAYWAEGNEE